MQKSIILNLLLFLGVVGCVSIATDTFPDYNALPTANAILVSGDSIRIKLSFTDGLDTSQIQTIDNAQIQLFVYDQLVEETGFYENGEYIFNTVVEENKNYTSKIIIPGFDTITCSQFMPEAEEIVNVDFIQIAGRNEEGTSYPAVKVQFTNKVNELKYYEIRIKLIKTSYTRNANLLNIEDSLLLNEGLPIALFSNELINDSTYTMKLNFTSNSASKTSGVWRTILYPTIIELRTVSYDYYQYQKTYYLYSEGLYPSIFEGIKPTEVYSNITNGYGIYAGYSVAYSDTIYPEAYE